MNSDFFDISDYVYSQENVDIAFGTENESIGKYIFVLRIADTDNALKIYIASSYIGEKGSGIDCSLDEKIKNALKDSYPVYADYNVIYEIVFNDYVMYQVRKEEFCFFDDYEIRSGKHLITFERSRLLDNYPSVVIKIFIEGTAVHYGVYAEQHIIDIISSSTPLIRKLYKKEFKNEFKKSV